MVLAAVCVNPVRAQTARGSALNAGEPLEPQAAELQLSFRGIEEGSQPISVCAIGDDSTGWLLMDRNRLVRVSASGTPAVTDSISLSVVDPIGLLPIGGSRYVVYGSDHIDVVTAAGGRLERTGSSSIVALTQGLPVIHAAVLTSNRILLATCCSSGSATSRYVVADIGASGLPALVGQLATMAPATRVGGKDSVMCVTESVTDAARVLFFRMTGSSFRLVAEWLSGNEQLAVLSIAATAPDAFTLLIRRKDVDAPSLHSYEVLRLNLDMTAGSARVSDRVALPSGFQPRDISLRDDRVFVLGAWPHRAPVLLAASAVIVFSAKGGAGLAPEDTIFGLVNASATTSDGKSVATGSIAVRGPSVAWADREGIEVATLGNSASGKLTERYRAPIRELGRDGCVRADTILIATPSRLVRLRLNASGEEAARESISGGADHVAWADSRTILAADTTLRALDWPAGGEPTASWSAPIRSCPLVDMRVSQSIIALDYGAQGIDVARLSASGILQQRSLPIVARSLQPVPSGFLLLDTAGKLFSIAIHSDSWSIAELALPIFTEMPTSMAATDSTIYVLSLGKVYRLRANDLRLSIVDSVRIGGATPFVAEAGNGLLYIGDAYGYSQLVRFRDDAPPIVQRWTTDHDAPRSIAFTGSGIAFAGGQHGLSHWRFDAAMGAETPIARSSSSEAVVTARRSLDGTISVVVCPRVEATARLILFDEAGRQAARSLDVEDDGASSHASIRPEFSMSSRRWLSIVVIAPNGRVIGSTVVE